MINFRLLEKQQEVLFMKVNAENKQLELMKAGSEVGFFTNFEVVKQWERVKQLIKQYNKISIQLEEK